MNNRILALTAIATAMAACSSIPDRNLALDQARIRYSSVQSESMVSRHASDELKSAGAALRLAEQAHADGAEPAQVDHLAYLTQQRATIAYETGAGRAAQAVTAGAGAERDRMRLALRTQEADAAQSRLVVSESESARKSDDLALAQRESARKSDDLALAQRSAEADKVRLERRDARLLDLRQQLSELNARNTERGLIVTLGDVMFDSGQAHLRVDGDRGMLKLADFMKRYPLRQASIEGFTDSIGSTTSNQNLSDRRAQAVKSALVGMGVGSDRMVARGHGEERPVADNGTSAGRQMNRRVEVIFANEPDDMPFRQ